MCGNDWIVGVRPDDVFVTPSKSGVQNALQDRSRALNKAVAKGVYEEPGDGAHVAVVLLIEGAEVADWIIFHDIFVSFGVLDRHPHTQIDEYGLVAVEAQLDVVVSRVLFSSTAH